MLNTFLIYSGSVTLALLFIYGLRNYTITLIAGFIAFCVFYFSFVVKSFEWEAGSILLQLKDAAIIYIISFVIAVLVYKLLPLKQKEAAVS